MFDRAHEVRYVCVKTDEVLLSQAVTPSIDRLVIQLPTGGCIIAGWPCHIDGVSMRRSDPGVVFVTCYRVKSPEAPK